MNKFLNKMTYRFYIYFIVSAGGMKILLYISMALSYLKDYFTIFMTAGCEIQERKAGTT